MQSKTDWARTRERIFERDGGMCQITGIFLSRAYYAIDHKSKCKMGGGFRNDEDHNLRLAHPIANQLREDGYSDAEIRQKLIEYYS